MRHAFNGNYPITRPFGVYDPAYANYPGSKHPGTDYGLPANTPLVAGMSGTVTTYRRSGASGRGNEVVITSGPVQRKACHMNRVDVETGQKIEEGQPIGLSGYTGYVVDAQGNVGTPDGAHLHDELLIDGVYVPLEEYLTEGEDMSQAVVDDLYKKLDQTNKNVDKLTKDLAMLFKIVDQAQKDIANKSTLPPGEYKLTVE